ncbi:MAG: MarR family transcriptional regulator [Anaerolineaceae bacterium]|nr:MarR family transcriptional regulator [Anaerolineaceae bacterium]MCB9101195.1 MarR family transcriptional regulator [Anaerolineales bacterium]
MDAASREAKVKKIKDMFVSLIWVSTRHFSQWIQTYGLTPPQFFTLSSLSCHQSPCTMRDLTEVTFQDPPTMTGIIDRLVKMKLVKRTRSEVDRRVVLVQPTQSGVELVTRINEEASQEAMKSYQTLMDEELESLEQSLYYLLRLQVSRQTSLTGEELDAEVQRMLAFRDDPIHFLKMKDKNSLKQPVES